MMSPSSFNASRTAPGDCQHQDLTDQSEPQICQYATQPMSTFSTINHLLQQPKSWYSLYYRIEAKRKSRPGGKLHTIMVWLPAGRQLPIQVLNRIRSAEKNMNSHASKIAVYAKSSENMYKQLTSDLTYPCVHEWADTHCPSWYMWPTSPGHWQTLTDQDRSDTAWDQSDCLYSQFWPRSLAAAETNSLQMDFYSCTKNVI